VGAVHFMHDFLGGGVEYVIRPNTYWSLFDVVYTASAVCLYEDFCSADRIERVQSPSYVYLSYNNRPTLSCVE